MKLTARLLELLILSLVLCCVSAITGCGTNCKDPQNASSLECTASNAVVTCGGSAIDQLVSEQLPGFEQQLGSAVLGDGSLDYNAAVPTLESYAMKFGMCFVTSIMAKLGSLHFAAEPGSSGPSHPTPKALADTLEKFRATHYTGTKFQKAAGQ